MGFAEEFVELATQTVVWRQRISVDAFNKPTYADPVLFSPDTSPGLGGRRSYKTSRRGAGGGGTPSGAAMAFLNISYIWILAVPPITEGDLVYILGDSPPYPTIVSIDQPADETGEKIYTKVTLGSAI